MTRPGGMRHIRAENSRDDSSDGETLSGDTHAEPVVHRCSIAAVHFSSGVDECETGESDAWMMRWVGLGWVVI